MSLRKAVFWLHLIAGCVAGFSIGIMCFTGTALAFEKQLVAWWERDARRVEPPDSATPLPLDELVARLGSAMPGFRPMSAVILNDPETAIAFSAGNQGTVYVDPYTGEARKPESTAMASFMRTMTSWHRYLNFTGPASRPRGKLINGVCNVAFLALACTGLYLWIPRSWSWSGMRGTAVLNVTLKGKARDFNWHNAIGLWCAPVLIVLTLTAMPISFRWAANSLYRITGTPVPAAGRTAPTPATRMPVPAAGSKILSIDELIAAAQSELPGWKQVTVRLGNINPKQPFALTVRESSSWPRTATTTLALDPYTGAPLRRDGYATMNRAQQLRSWTRFLHTGEALGVIGQLAAGIACLGGCFLVYTGLALAIRRFARRRPPAGSS